MQPLIRSSVKVISARSFATVSLKVDFTRVSGAKKQYDVTTEEGTSLLEAMKCAGIPIQSRCGGNCVCGTCIVKMSPELHDQTIMGAKEKGLLRRKGKGDSCYHLACQTYVYNLMEGEVIEVNYHRA
ncbi:Ferredoxin [Blastocystis sp. ATCC 50177/Nand II]|uniref:Ferredoxin n=1 Tax=Blastocystis sp. subtype 1 (strain ATCC 50177 / NandII) TaxID=478820 RepID=A0A196S987_BLAHN|nr:Ferredoxin [Blastocystis sp. ATCC 50177/Nand II]